MPERCGFHHKPKENLRLMKKHNLLFSSKIGKVKAPRTFVRYRKIEVDTPLKYMCMDIKYIHIHGAKRNALLLTVIDVYSRKALTYMLKFNIRKEDMMMLLSLLILEYRIAGYTIRNDNGSQFIAKMVREFLIEKGVIQEFTHVATPEENSYIEAFHSIVQIEVVERFDFESFHHAKMFFLALWMVQQRTEAWFTRQDISRRVFENKGIKISVPYKTKHQNVSNFYPKLTKKWGVDIKSWKKKMIDENLRITAILMWGQHDRNRGSTSPEFTSDQISIFLSLACSLIILIFSHSPKK